MSQGKTNIFKAVCNVLTSGGASMTLMSWWLASVFLAAMAGAGINGNFAPYYAITYYLTIIGLAIFLMGVLLSFGTMAPTNKKSAVNAIIASALFLGALIVMFSDVDTSGDLKDAAKSAYLVLAIRAVLLFAGFLFLNRALKRSDLDCKKVWKVVAKITIILMMAASLLTLIPVAGDMLFALISIVLAIVLFVCLFPIINTNK